MPVLPEDMEGIFPYNMESACIGRLLFDNKACLGRGPSSKLGCAVFQAFHSVEAASSCRQPISK
jgi:hypothetical protein